MIAVMLLVHAPLSQRGVCLFGKARLSKNAGTRIGTRMLPPRFAKLMVVKVCSVAPAKVAIVQAHCRPGQVKPPG